MKAINQGDNSMNENGEKQALQALLLVEIDHVIFTAKTLQGDLSAIKQLLPEILGTELLFNSTGLAKVNQLNCIFTGLNKDLPFLRHPELASYWLDYGVEKLQCQQRQILPLAKQLGNFISLPLLPAINVLAELQLNLSNQSLLRYLYPSWRSAKQQLLGLASAPLSFSQLQALLPAMLAYRGYIDEFEQTLLQHPCLVELDFIDKGCFSNLSIISQIREEYKHIAFCWCNDVVGYKQQKYLDALLAISNITYPEMLEIERLFEQRFQPTYNKFEKQMTKLKLAYREELKKIGEKDIIAQLEALRTTVGN